MLRSFGKVAFTAAVCLILLCGCESWRRTASSVQTDAPPVPTEEVGEEYSADESVESVENEAAEMQSAKVSSRADESNSWATSDEMLSRRLYDLLTYKNEIFSEKFDEREYDFLAVMTDDEGTEHRLLLWINFQRENEIIVEDESGSQWNISVEDSNHVRSLVSSLS